MSDSLVIDLVTDTPKPLTAAIKSFTDGAKFALYMLVNFKDLDAAEFTLQIGKGQQDARSTALLVERTKGAGVTLQLYMPESISPANEDGWYVLMEPRFHSEFSIDNDVSTTWEDEIPPGMIRSRLAEGVIFSKRMYAPIDMAVESLSFFIDGHDFPDLVKNKPWKFVGLI
jgi:hypothetical protein